MGTQDVTGQLTGARLRAFSKQLLNDLHALDQMVRDGVLDGDTRCIGAEQELFLVDKTWRPAPLALEMLEALNDENYTTELARFNLEFNLDPHAFGGGCLSQLERDLEVHLEKAREAADRLGIQVALTGILPTLAKSDLDLEFMTPRSRYYALNEALTRLRGSDYHFRLRGLDELDFKHSSVMLEACNTSFQIHFQVGAQEFASLYNLAQVVTAPVLAVAANSPLLFGKRLWSETRIALFQQSVDTRSTTEHLRETSPRVSFGDRWVKNGVLDIYREDVTRFKALLGTEETEDSLAQYAAGEIPRLKALQLHNSTVYRWNRPCYGVADGKAHLRIENRVLPAGPTVVDEVANATFWFGLMAGFSRQYDDITQVMRFDDAASNFLDAARHGLDTSFTWFEERRVSARELILSELLPIARDGLNQSGINPADIDRYLGTIEARVEAGRTGASWMVDSLKKMRNSVTDGEKISALVASTIHQQKSGKPLHEWDRARTTEAGGWKHNFLRVEQYMTTELFTVGQDEVVDLVANMMHWKHIRHVPVEDREHQLVGLVSYRTLLRYLAAGMASGQSEPVAVSEVMETNLVTITPSTSTLEALRLMRERGVSCLPVVSEEGRLVGMVSERDFVNVARQLMEESLAE